MRWMRAFVCLVLLACIVQAGAAFSVKETKVPKTDLLSNEQVQVSLDILLTSFSNSNDLVVSSSLKNQELTVQTYSDEMDRYIEIQTDVDRFGNWIIFGWVLPSDKSFTIQVLLKGTVPETTTTKTITLIQVVEKSGGANVFGSEYRLERRIVNPQEITSQITTLRSDAQKLKQNITTVASTGIDGSQALTKVNDAEKALNSADSLKASNFTQAQNYIETARNAIKDGYNLLDKARAQYEIDKVERTLSDVESMIKYFTTNRSMSTTDPRVVAITNKYDIASQSISSANDFLTSGNYISAMSKAAEATKYANEANNLSSTLKKDLGEGGGIALPGISPLFIMIGIGVVIIGAVGIFLYRKFFRWDELG